MINVETGSRNELRTNVIDSMHEFRHEVFVGRLGWDLPLEDGVERDEYDTPATMYVVLQDDEQITACARLLRTTSKYMLPELFPQLLGDCEAPCDESIWEISRFATAIRETRQGRALSFSALTLELWEKVFAFARQNGVKRLASVTSISIERLLLRSGFEAHRIAPPAMVDGALAVALFVEVPDHFQCDPAKAN